MMQNSFSAARFLQVRLNHHEKPSSSVEGGGGRVVSKESEELPTPEDREEGGEQGIDEEGPAGHACGVNIANHVGGCGDQDDHASQFSYHGISSL